MSAATATRTPQQESAAKRPDTTIPAMRSVPREHREEHPIFADNKIGLKLMNKMKELQGSGERLDLIIFRSFVLDHDGYPDQECYVVGNKETYNWIHDAKRGHSDRIHRIIPHTKRTVASQVWMEQRS